MLALTFFLLIFTSSNVLAIALPPLPDSIAQEHDFYGQPHLSGAIEGKQISRDAWTVSASEHRRGPAVNAIDDDHRSIWVTGSAGQHPHSFVIDMRSEHNVNGFSYLPRQDNSLLGNIGAHELHLSLDGKTWKRTSCLWNVSR